MAFLSLPGWRHWRVGEYRGEKEPAETPAVL